jgi:hypothetical protein
MPDTPEQQLTGPAELPQDKADKVGRIADLLGGPDEPEGTEAQSEPTQAAQEPDTEPEPQASEPADAEALTPQVLAERLGITPTELFRELRIPIEGGEPLTLEEIKRAGTKLRGVSEVTETLEQQRVDFENEVMTQRQQLQNLIGQLPQDSLSPEFVQNVTAIHSNYVATETQALLEVRPDLKDPDKFRAVRQLMIDFAAPYGFKAVEIDGIIDHRLAKFVIDMAEKDQRIRQLEKDAAHKPRADRKRQSRTPAPVSQTRRNRAAAARAKGGTREDKVSAINALLGENK